MLIEGLYSEASRGDKTGFELRVEGVRVWGQGIRRMLSIEYPMGSPVRPITPAVRRNGCSSISPFLPSVCVLVLVLVLACGLQGCAALEGARPDIRQAEQDLSRSFNGVVLAEDAGRIVSFAAYGQASHGVPTTTRHRFRIGSVTKTFTSAMIARLEEQGKLGIDDPLSKHLPGFPGGDAITLRHLIDHRSGIRDLSQHDFKSLMLREEPIELRDVVAVLQSKKAVSQPGAKRSYNNAGYILLGAVIERVTGKTYAVAVQDEFLSPLGMDDTGYAVFDSEVEGLATGHLSGMKPDPQRYNYSGILAAGGMYSTAEDLRTWAHALDSLGAEWYRKDRLGWTTGERYNRDAAWHTGNTNTYAALLVRFPTSDSCLVVLSNEAREGIPAEVRTMARAAFERASAPASPR